MPRPRSAKHRSFAVCWRVTSTYTNMINVIAWVIPGSLLGMAANSVTRTGPKSLLPNVVIGILGALLGGGVLSPLFGIETFGQDEFSIPALLVSFLAAIILLVIVNLAREEAKLHSTRRRRYGRSTKPSRHSKAQRSAVFHRYLAAVDRFQRIGIGEALAGAKRKIIQCLRR